MRGRSRGNQERILILAHQSAMMARQERLRPLSAYLDPPKAARKTGASAVLAMLRRMKAKQDAKGPANG